MYKTLFGLTIAGVLFSGYMSGVKFFSKTCAFGETCPYFFGIPACYIGFILFLILAILAGLLVFGDKNRKTLKNMTLVSLLGVLFAGYYTILELPLLFSEGLSAYMLVLPTCALGLIFFVIILLMVLRAKKRWL